MRNRAPPTVRHQEDAHQRYSAMRALQAEDSGKQLPLSHPLASCSACSLQTSSFLRIDHRFRTFVASNACMRWL
jgi:hypothetical protein